MTFRPLAPDFAISPQIDPADLPQIAQAGYTTVICNRPDGENPPSHQAAVMEAEAAKAGISFVYNPMGGGGLSMDMIDEQAEAIAGSEGKTLAYCASGMRSAMLWAFAMTGEMSSDDILEALAKAGLPMPHLAPQLDQIAAARD